MTATKTPATAPNAKQNRRSKMASNTEGKEHHFLDISINDNNELTTIRRYFINENEKNYFIAWMKGDLPDDCY